MSAESDLERAVQLFTQGKRRESAAILMTLQERITDKVAKLTLIDASLSALDRLTEHRRLEKLSLEGIAIAEETKQEDLQAHFMARRADLLMMTVATVYHQRTLLRLAPSWIGFALEADRLAYEALTREYDKLEREVDDLLGRALSIAERIGNRRILAFVLTGRGSVSSARYLEYKSESLRDPLRAKLWSRYQILRYPLFERSFMFRAEPRKRLSKLVKSFTNDYLRAAELFESIGDAGAGSAYYNLANHLRTAYRFSAARKYLSMAQRVARRHGDRLVIQQCQQLREVIKKRNKDIPDYLHGERREPAS